MCTDKINTVNRWTIRPPNHHERRTSGRVHVCSPKRNSPKGLSPHNIPGGQDPKPQWGPGPKVQWH